MLKLPDYAPRGPTQDPRGPPPTSPQGTAIFDTEDWVRPASRSSSPAGPGLQQDRQLLLPQDGAWEKRHWSCVSLGATACLGVASHCPGSESPCPMGVGAAGNGGSVTVRQGTGPVPSLQPANDRAEHCKPARPGPRMRQPPPPAVAGRFCQAGGPRGRWKWHLLDPCSQGAPGVLQACQGDVHPENLVGSLWAAFPESKAAPSRAALAVHVCERLGQVLPANSLRAARSRAVSRGQG